MIPLQRLTGPDGGLRVHTDQFGILIALNQALESMGQAYPASVMLPVINEIHALRLDDCDSRQAYFHGLADILARHSIDPWQGRTVAVLGFTHAENDRSSLLTDDVQCLLKGATVIDLSKERHGNRLLNRYNAHALAAGRQADFVITGNVINAPDNCDGLFAWDKNGPADTMWGCATLLKPGGLAIHLLGYGDGNQRTHCLEDTAFLRAIGQEHVINYPDRSFAKDPAPQAAIYRQVRAIELPPLPKASDFAPDARVKAATAREPNA